MGSKNPKRDQVVRVYMTEREKEMVQEHVERAGYSSESGLGRVAILSFIAKSKAGNRDNNN